MYELMLNKDEAWNKAVFLFPSYVSCLPRPVPPVLAVLMLPAPRQREAILGKQYLDQILPLISYSGADSRRVWIGFL